MEISMRFWRNTKYDKIDNWETENSLHKPRIYNYDKDNNK